MPPPMPPKAVARPGGASRRSLSGPTGQVPSRFPRSSSGSPIVHISQSTMAATSGPSGEIITFDRW